MSRTPIQLYGPCTVPKPALAPIAIHPYAIPASPPVTPQAKQPMQQQPQQQASVYAQALMHHRLHPDFLAKYSLGEELGSGGFGFVVSAYERHTGTERAVKFILRHKVPAHAYVRDPELGMIPMEIYVLKHVHHPNVIGYVDSYKDDTYFYLVMELHGTQWLPRLHRPPPIIRSRRTVIRPRTRPHSHRHPPRMNPTRRSTHPWTSTPRDASPDALPAISLNALNDTTTLKSRWPR